MSTLLVASSGGHLAQLLHLRPRLQGIDRRAVWVTFDTPQSRSLLEGHLVLYIQHTATRDYRNLLRNTASAPRILRGHEITAVVSTGAGIALSFLPMARAQGLKVHYIESATRAAGPSLTGRLLQAVPGINLYAQHPGWAHGRWRYGGSVFDGYEVREAPDSQLRRAVVTLGAHQMYGFRRLVERLVAILPPDVEVLWQTGATGVAGLPIDARPFVPAAELEAAIREADLVVGHAGIGATLAALDAGHCPVVVPRSHAHGEHIDDHQVQVVNALRGRDIVVAREPEELELGDLLRAVSRRVVRAETPPPFVLAGARPLRPEWERPRAGA